MTELKVPELNRVLISGRLTRDPDRRYAAEGTAVTGFSLAFHRRYRGRDGKPAEQTGYVNVMSYDRLAEVCGEYLHRGSAVLVEGRLQLREWTTTEGEKRTRLEIRADMVHFLERRPESEADAETQPSRRGDAESSSRADVTSRRSRGKSWSRRGAAE